MNAEEESKQTERDKSAKRIWLYLQIFGAFAASLTGAFFAGKSVGNNQVILELPAKVEAVQRQFSQQIAETQERAGKAFEAQNKINQETLKLLTDLRQDLSVHVAWDQEQSKNLARLERQIDALQAFINQKPK